MKGLFALLLVVLVQGVRSQNQKCCDNESGCFPQSWPYAHLPLPSRCPLDYGITFGLHTRNNRNNHQLITRSNTPGQFSSSRRTIFLVHGWTGNLNSDWLIDAKNALLNRGNYNVIIVGWGSGANELYWNSAGNTRAIASEIGIIAGRLVSRNGANRSNMWCVGHSLGAHICGIVGDQNRNVNNFKFGRVTGLDPAGPSWEEFDIRAGINSNSGDFVDIIHSDGRYYGQDRPLGHYDYYPNNGKNQPGCLTYIADEDLQDILTTSGEDLDRREYRVTACSHGRACEFFIESVKSDCFRSNQKCSNHNNMPGSCSGCGNNCAFMGYAAERTSGGRGNYYLTTTSNRPFCLG